MEYLTEEKLKIFLYDYIDNEFEFNKSVPFSKNKRLRPDFINEKLKLIVEFDGYGHYLNPKQILNDQFKDKEYPQLGYRIIRIPYFVQLSSDVINNLFKLNIDYKQTYPHGFIDKKAILPSSYCELGINRFLQDLEKFSFIKKDILESLKQHKDFSKNIDLILPKSIQYLISTIDDGNKTECEKDK